MLCREVSLKSVIKKRRGKHAMALMSFKQRGDRWSLRVDLVSLVLDQIEQTILQDMQPMTLLLLQETLPLPKLYC